MFQFCVLFAVLVLSLKGPQNDLITEWPGLASLPEFEMYSGYLDASPEKHLHYLFVECADNPNAPLVVWLNGGPGSFTKFKFCTAALTILKI